MLHRFIFLYCLKAGFWLFVVLLFGLTSCTQPKQDSSKIKAQLVLADSLYYAGRGQEGQKLLIKLRPQIKNTDPLITTYYGLRELDYFNNGAGMTVYADSALAFFKSDERKTTYPNYYFKALLAKGDACVKLQKYTLALRYYYQAREVLPGGDCDNGDLASKIGGIYYDQRKFVLAARYWAESYKGLSQCGKEINQQKLFFLKQGALNNAGFSYERAGMLDSASIYYIADLNLIKRTDSLNLVAKLYLPGAYAVIYDNLGGLYLKRGNIAIAEEYLNKSLALLPPTITDGARIPPLLKLAEVYLIKGDYPKAAKSLAEGRANLNKYYKQNPASQLNWIKLQARYLDLTGKHAEAYKYQNAYIATKDSSDNTSAELFRLDVEREMNTLQQEQSLGELMQKNDVKQLYLEGSVVIVVLFVIIIILVNRNLKRTKAINKGTVLQNQQLQAALSELETLNKNYIRVMRVMAHDLRNPLSGIMGIAAMVLEEESSLSEENRHLLKIIESTSNSSLEMINELLESGLTNDSQPMEKEPHDLRALLFDSVELLQFKAKDKQQEIVFNSIDESIMANVNYENIWRVFNNLIINAIKFSHEGGVIKVGITLHEKNILISVADNGIGIPDKDKDNVFEMFTSAKKAGTHGEQPFGLGLSISKKIIEAHGGRIWFDSKTGEGTVFFVELPG
ncbi:tetratricopeptide repeat-containing sensor histidine kinase [Mucilaginibacter pedocola]|uniref:histidine kinase n=1 Tax=Mucilaginibacter pedocola TaxID=1792845 RepID=A0A1S9PN42_9SPHI|nr:ATP-binding protein [Mucilaginibacter pedocola]OOQ61998.1 hypothetical protein BC343_02790 [Mucilaginibacter pedocola]